MSITQYVVSFLCETTINCVFVFFEEVNADVNGADGYAGRLRDGDIFAASAHSRLLLFHDSLFLIGHSGFAPR